MRNKSSITYLILSIIALLFSCGETTKTKNESNASSNSGEKYAIDLNQSSVIWKGSMIIGDNSHIGNAYLSKGELIIENGKLVGGTATVNMNSIVDETHDSASKLVEHLKSPDFFDVKKFPTATIVITNVVPINHENATITGNLTIKGVTQAISFPAKIEVEKLLVKMSGKLNIDRTQWNIIYKSGKFYDLLADQTISDTIEFSIKVIAKNKS